MLGRLAIAAGLGLFGLAGLWSFGVGTPGAFNLPTPFSSSRWKASTGSRQARCSMVADLTHRIGVVGRTENEVIDLLGKPDEQENASTSAYLFCPNVADIYILELTWKRGGVTSALVRDT
jgi:hypothetical protein